MKFEKLNNEIMKLYEPLKKQYVEQHAVLQSVMKSKDYTTEYKTTRRENAIENLKKLRDKTLEEVEQKIEKLIEVEKREAKEGPYYATTESAILSELRKNNRLVLAVNNTKNATPIELEQMFEVNPDDSDVVTIIKAQLKAIDTSESKNVLNKIAEHEADTPIRFLTSRLGVTRIQKAQANNIFYFGDEQRDINVDFGINADKRAEFFR